MSRLSERVKEAFVLVRNLRDESSSTMDLVNELKPLLQNDYTTKKNNTRSYNVYTCVYSTSIDRT